MFMVSKKSSSTIKTYSIFIEISVVNTISHYQCSVDAVCFDSCQRALVLHFMRRDDLHNPGKGQDLEIIGSLQVISGAVQGCEPSLAQYVKAPERKQGGVLTWLSVMTEVK